MSESEWISELRMAWMMVFFDLPVGTPDERRDASRFREDLKKDGYFMVQFSVYARACVTEEKVKTHMRRLKPLIPPNGEVRALVITDLQWKRMVVYFGNKPKQPEEMPEQLSFL